MSGVGPMATANQLQPSTSKALLAVFVLAVCLSAAARGANG